MDTITDFRGGNTIRVREGLGIGNLAFKNNNIILSRSNKILATWNKKSDAIF